MYSERRNLVAELFQLVFSLFQARSSSRNVMGWQEGWRSRGEETISWRSRSSRRRWSHNALRFAATLLAFSALFASCKVFAQIPFAQTGFVFPSSVTVGTASAPQTVSVTLRSGGTLSAIQVQTEGATGLDYSSSPGTCATGTTYAPTQVCTVGVTFTPQFPGARGGSIVLLDGSGNPLAIESLYGIGIGPLSVFTAGGITTVAGNGLLSTGPVGPGLAVNTVIHEPLGVAPDGDGNFYYTDSGNHRIGRVDTSGNLTIVAGTGAAGFSPNGTPAASAQVSAPAALILDGAGNIFFTELGNSTVREIVKSTGLIETVAGTGTPGYTGDNGPAAAATLNQPEGITFDLTGNLYISDTLNHVIRTVSAATGTISTIAGNGTSGFAGDGGPATGGLFNEPWGISVATDGSLYIADFLNNRIRRIDPAGMLSTVVGTGVQGYSGDTRLAYGAYMNHPASVVVDAAGDLFISDSENNVIRKVNGPTQIITTLAGNSAANSTGDGQDADDGNVGMDKPYGLALDGSGDLFIADRLGLRVRELYGVKGALPYPDIKVTNTSKPEPQTIDNDGNAPLHLASITVLSNAAIDAASTTCSTSTAMVPGAACVVGVEFKPATVGQNVFGQINIASDSANTPISVYPYGNSLSIDPTTTTLSSSLNPSAVGAPVTFTAIMTSQATTLTGTVQFLDGTTVLGGAAQIVNSSTRTATLTTTSLALGSHSITAVYSGDNSNQTSSSSPALVQVVKQTSTLTLTSGTNPAHVYDAVTFTVAVSASPSGGTAPTGSIVFSSDGSFLPSGTVGISNGVAVYTTSLLAAGTHTITATYAGDTSNLASTSNALTETINLATTSTTLTTSNASVPLSTPVTFTASVLGSPSSTPTGTIVFMDGGTAIGTATLNSTGSASLTTLTLATGSHAITAVYSGDTDYATSTSSTLTQNIQKIATGAAIASSANPAAAGATVNFTIVITAANSTSPNVPITGQVTVMEGAALLGTGTLSALGNGPATATVTVPVASLAAGSHAITAIYAGDGNYTASTSSALLETVGLALSHTVLTSSATSIIATRPITLTATVSSNGGTPTGNVVFLDGTSAIGSGNLTNGVATYTTAGLAVGNHTITAAYQGDAKDATSTSSAVTIVVNQATTAVALTPSQNPTNFGQSFTLDAIVSGNGGTPTGSITFFDGATPLQSQGVNGTGLATFTTTTLADGPHTFTAVYAGDINDQGSTSPPLVVKVLQTVMLTITSPSPNPSVARSNIHFIATITPLQGIQPTGSITFFDNGSLALGSGLINGNTATFDTTALTVGTHAIVASYGGDSATQPFNSAAYSQTVNAAGASVTIASSANPATFGTLLTFTAVASSPAGPLTGTVNFQDGGATIGSGTLGASGVAIFSTATLAPGVHSIVAAYLGDANDQPASSSMLQQTVERATTLTLASSQNPLLTLAPVTITATVANGGGAAATGTITFSQDSVAVATVPVGPSGTATYTAASLPAGSHSFVADYSGDAIDLASASAPLNEVVQLRPTSDVLTTSATSLTGGQQITLISILHWNGPATPTGTVTFTDGSLTLATAPVDSTGVATVTVLLSGTSATITSTYSGDAAYAPSISAPDLVPIGPAQNFTMDLTPSTITVASKQHTAVQLTIASLRGYTDTLSLGCLGLPERATCIFSSDQMVLTAGGSATVTLTIDTGNPLLAGAQAKNEAPSGTKLALACFLPGGLILGFIGLRSRRLRGLGGLLLILCLAGVSTALSGCGGITMNGVSPGTYNFNVSAVGRTGINQSLPVTMTVTQ